jgi:hypothetical protein
MGRESKNLLILNSEQLAALFEISEFTVKKLAKSKELPCDIVKGKPFFDAEKVLLHFHKLEGGLV